MALDVCMPIQNNNKKTARDKPWMTEQLKVSIQKYLTDGGKLRNRKKRETLFKSLSEDNEKNTTQIKFKPLKRRTQTSGGTSSLKSLVVKNHLEG